MFADVLVYCVHVQDIVVIDRRSLFNHQDGNTALHVAARDHKYNQDTKESRVNCVRALLSHPGIDVYIKDNEGHTAMMDAGYKSLGVFNQIMKTCSDFPADSYGKVVLYGNSGAGKSTLTQVS